VGSGMESINCFVKEVIVKADFAINLPFDFNFTGANFVLNPEGCFSVDLINQGFSLNLKV
jgi:hypothetical protein